MYETAHATTSKEIVITQDTQIVLPFARLCGKTLQADFDGGTLTSDGGVLFLREMEAHVGVIRRFVEVLDDRRDPRYTDHSYEEMLRQRIFQLACGYDDANDCNSLRRDPAFKAACERLPIGGEAFASQPTMSRLEHAPRRSELYRMAQALLDTFMASYERAPTALLLDIKASGIPKVTSEGKADFHACRAVYITMLFESGATLKEAQELARHITPQLTANVYAKVRDERLASLVEHVGQALAVTAEHVPSMRAEATGTENVSICVYYW